MINIASLKRKIRSISEKTHDDVKVLMVVDSFWGCSDNYIKANLCASIAKYAGCEAWKIVMDDIYRPTITYNPYTNTSYYRGM